MEHALPRTWSLCMTSENHGAVGKAGDPFSHAPGKHERVLVVEVPAAANKAAEEGRLPVVSWLERESLCQDTEFSQIDRMGAEIVDWRNLYRASRQVANKAEVEPDKIDAERYRWLRNHGDKEGQPPVMLQGRWHGGSNGVGFNLDEAMNSLMGIATPPATTGASTEDTEFLKFTLKRHMERVAELEAAQAGQVAVPAWISVDERLPSVPVNSDRQFIIACQRANGKTYVFAASYLNALELDSNDDGESVFTGWHTEGEHAEYSSWYEPVCQAGDKVTHWQELPAAPSPAKESK